MQNINIKSWKNRLLSRYILEDDGSLTLFVLVTLGIVAALLHEHLRMGLNLPGHHGLEWMTLLLFGRMQSHDRWAGLMIASGAAITCILYSMSLPLTESLKPALVYIMNGVCVDVMYKFLPGNFPVLLKGTLMGGVTFMLKPLALIPIVMFMEVSFGSISKHGYMYPVLTHFLFGTIGAVAGISLASLASHSAKKQDN